MVTFSAIQFFLTLLLLPIGQLLSMVSPLTAGKCPPDTIMCLDGSQCYNASLRCDGNKDCDDETDEYNCENHSPDVLFPENNSLETLSSETDTKDEGNLICPESSMLCHSGDQCIEKYLRCNEIIDCADGSDELNCPTRCDEHHSFTCDNGNCIGNELHCNGNDDCGDSSDEAGCSHYIDMNCSAEEFVCPDGTCLARTRVCDGEINCKGGSDEKEPCPPPYSSAENDASERSPRAVQSGTMGNPSTIEVTTAGTTTTFSKSNIAETSYLVDCIPNGDKNCDGGHKTEDMKDMTDMDRLMNIKLQILEQDRSNKDHLYQLQVKELTTRNEAALIELKAAEAWCNAMLERLQQQREEHRLSVAALLSQPSLTKNQTEALITTNSTVTVPAATQ